MGQRCTVCAQFNRTPIEFVLYTSLPGDEFISLLLRFLQGIGQFRNMSVDPLQGFLLYGSFSPQ